jgi:type I restriction enzyme R subunit
MPLPQIIQNLANQIDPDFHLSILMRRLHQIDRSITLEGKTQLEEYLPEVSDNGLATAWLNLFESSQDKALALLEMADFQDFLDNYPHLTSSLQNLSAISHPIPDHLLIDGKHPTSYLDKFCQFISDNRLEVEKLFHFPNDLNFSDGLNFALMSSEGRWGILRLRQLKQMLIHFDFTESNIQKAFQFVYGKADIDLISLTKWGLDQSNSVYTASERVHLAIALVIEKFNLNEKQSRFLGSLREYLIQNLCVELTDLEQVLYLKQLGLPSQARNLFNQQSNLQLRSFIGCINVAIAMVG